MRHPGSSRQRYRVFTHDYGQQRAVSRQEGKVRPGTVGALRAGSRTREHLRSYFRLLRPYRYALGGVVLCMLLVAAVDMVLPLFMRFVVDHVLLNPNLDTASRLSRLHTSGAVFVGVLVVYNALSVLREYRLRLLNIRVTLSLRRALFERLLYLPLPTLWSMRTGGILSRLTGDVDSTTTFVHTAIMAPGLAVLRMAVAVTALMMLNWRLAVAAAAVVPVTTLILLGYTRRIKPIYRSIRQDAEQIDGRVAESFSGIRVVRAFGGEKREVLDYIRGRHTLLRKELFAHRRDLAVTVSWGVLTAGVNVVIMWLGGYLTVTGRATIGDIMAFQWYVLQLLNPIALIANSGADRQRALAAMERVFEVLEMPHDKPDRPGAVDAPLVVREIRLEGVEFEYREGRPVVRDFNVTAAGGSVIALVGRSGAGKTTVTDLVARFHDPTRGRVLLNGCDIRDFRLKSYRDRLAIVQQDVFLFDGTVRDNIAYGRRDATDEEIEDACRRANAHEFIARLPEQYETLIGERGVKLSGGQRQRLAIARALLKSPQILILDEATSNLDTESEQLIQASMSTLLAGRTTFVIAHRLSTIRRADLILLMQDGRIVERGTHEDLMAAGGAYARMVVRQMEAALDDGSDSFAATIPDPRPPDLTPVGA